VPEEELGELPEGWEVRHTANGRIYFVDHNTKTTQFTDPRLARKLPQLHAEGQLPKYKRDLVQKMKRLRTELQAYQPQSGHCKIEVSREDIFEESYRQIMKMRPKDLKKRLMIKFRGEDGLDYGGIAREWLYLLSHEMLNPYYGLFQYSRDDLYTLQINPNSSINPEHLSYFHFVGRIIGMAVFHGHYIDGGFAQPFYKQMLGKPNTLEDMEFVDPEYYNSLTWMLENDITGVIDSVFTVQHEVFGEMKTFELKPGGSDIPVTQENKKEYAKLLAQWRFRRGVEKQMQVLMKGVHEFVPSHLLRLFDERELELVIGGLGKIDLDDWKANTKLKHCSAEHPVVKWFWQIVESYDEEKRARLLQFVTGSSRVPLEGFKALQGSTGAAGPRLFTIHLVDSCTDLLPKAHTCFNRLDMPKYETYVKMYEKLTCAVEETLGFLVE
jgi:E3 ubiquitin ligase SMURF1/2